MTKSLVAAVLSAVLALTIGVGGSFAAKKEKAAAGGKEVTVKGTMVCAKCSLKETASCQNVLKVTEDGKEVKYYLVHNDIAKANHKPVCSGQANAMVKGTLAEDGGKKNLTPSEIKYE